MKLFRLLKAKENQAELHSMAIETYENNMFTKFFQ